MPVTVAPRRTSAPASAAAESSNSCASGWVKTPHAFGVHRSLGEVATEGRRAVHEQCEPEHLLRDGVKDVGNAEQARFGSAPWLHGFPSNPITELGFPFRRPKRGHRGRPSGGQAKNPQYRPQ